MKRSVLIFVLLQLCIITALSQTKRSTSNNKAVNTIPVELVEQIINEHAARDWVNSNYNGNPVKFSQSWEVKRVALNKDRATGFIIQALDTYFSGSHESSLFIYQKTENGYKSLAEDSIAISVDERVLPGVTYTNGYLDLLLKANGRTVSKIIFDGKYYRLKH